MVRGGGVLRVSFFLGAGFWLPVFKELIGTPGFSTLSLLTDFCWELTVPLFSLSVDLSLLFVLGLAFALEFELGLELELELLTWFLGFDKFGCVFDLPT